MSYQFAKSAFLLMITYFLFSYTSNATDHIPGLTISPDSIPATDTGELRVFEKLDIEAKFAGGEDGWRRYLEQNLNGNIPVDKGAPDGAYTVWVQFIVDTDGSVSGIKALTRHGYGMEAEVMRILRKSPKWLPGEQNGRIVKAYRKQPVTFLVQTVKRKRRNKD